MEQILTTTSDTHPVEAPALSGNFDRDCEVFSAYWQNIGENLRRLPPKPSRAPEEQAQATSLLSVGQTTRRFFLEKHVSALYRNLTRDFTQKHRVDAIGAMAAALVPGLVPDRESLDAEHARLQKDKDGHEIDQAILFNAILADPQCGMDLCHAMLLPKPESLSLLEDYKHTGRIDLSAAAIERSGKTSTVLFKNPAFLHAEDDITLGDVETAVDLALLDPQTELAILRGSPLESGKYAGQRVFCTGINLTHLYEGKIPYIWYLLRDLGFINKIYRGLALPDRPPTEETGDSIEKPWIGAVENFAIGGGCQYLLVTDYVVAEESAYMTLPARKEGIIPGVANMRLPRFVGDRLARQAIQYERRLDCDSPEGRMICDNVVPKADFEKALAEAAHRLTDSGVVSVASNRRAFRITEEPLDDFRRFMAMYAREQAKCHFSPALISNLERFWNSRKQK